MRGLFLGGRGQPNGPKALSLATALASAFRQRSTDRWEEHRPQRRRVSGGGLMPIGSARPAGRGLDSAPAIRTAPRGHYLAVAHGSSRASLLEQARGEMTQRQRAVPPPIEVDGQNESVAVVPCVRRWSATSEPRRLSCWALCSWGLLIACADVAHLLLAGAAGRQRELRLAPRSERADGASPQLLTESILLALWRPLRPDSRRFGCPSLRCSFPATSRVSPK